MNQSAKDRQPSYFRVSLTDWVKKISYSWGLKARGKRVLIRVSAIKNALTALTVAIILTCLLVLNTSSTSVIRVIVIKP